MKGILKFDLDDKEDRMAHLRCIKSLDMAIIIFELQHNFMRLFDDRASADIDELSKELNNLIGDLNINELIE